jgi:predicted GTPase
LKKTYEKYPKLGPLVPAMGYSKQQLVDLGASVDAVPADIVLAGTPIDLGRLIKPKQPIHRVRYDLVELPGEKRLGDVLDRWLSKKKIG